jgi:hypothetical protein
MPSLLVLFVWVWFLVVQPGCCALAPLLHGSAACTPCWLSSESAAVVSPKQGMVQRASREPLTALVVDNTLLIPGYIPWQDPLAQCSGLSRFGAREVRCCGLPHGWRLCVCVGHQLLLCGVMLPDVDDACWVIGGCGGGMML